MALPNFRVAQTLHGNQPMIVHKAPDTGMLVTTSEQFLAGQVIRLQTNNTIVCAVDDEAAAYGVALHDAINNDGVCFATVPIAVFDGNNVFSGDNRGTDLALGTHIGDTAELEFAGGANTQNVGIGTAGNALFIVVGEDTQDDATTGGYRVLVGVPAAKSQFAPYGTAAADAPA